MSRWRSSLDSILGIDHIALSILTRGFIKEIKHSRKHAFLFDFSFASPSYFFWPLARMHLHRLTPGYVCGGVEVIFLEAATQLSSFTLGPCGPSILVYAQASSILRVGTGESPGLCLPFCVFLPQIVAWFLGGVGGWVARACFFCSRAGNKSGGEQGEQGARNKNRGDN